MPPGTAAWPAGIPVPESGTLLLEAEVRLDNVYDVGRTPFGQRKVAVTQEGTMNGPAHHRHRAAGRPGLRAGPGQWCAARWSRSWCCRPATTATPSCATSAPAPAASDVRIVYDFEAPIAGQFAWLNTGKYVGRRTIDATNKTMKLSIYEVTSVAVATDAARIGQDRRSLRGVPPQPWDFRKPGPGEERGETILVESVALGRSQAIQNGKRGSRNVIPITGGTLEGMVAGKVLFGGADYQNPTTGPAIDARYLWQTTEGDVIIVRNAGPFNALIPTFETPCGRQIRVAELRQVPELAARRRRRQGRRAQHRHVQGEVNAAASPMPLCVSAATAYCRQL